VSKLLLVMLFLWFWYIFFRTNYSYFNDFWTTECFSWGFLTSGHFQTTASDSQIKTFS